MVIIKNESYESSTGSSPLTFRERYRFDDLMPGQCMVLTHGAHQDEVSRIVAAYRAYATYRGYVVKQETDSLGAKIWRVS